MKTLLLILMLPAIAACDTKTKDIPSTADFVKSGGRTAYFAGGCFWCVEKDFEHVAGVSEVISGYSGGALENPTYKNHGDHAEIVEIRYDPKKVTYEQLVNTFWRTIDPFAVDKQFCDVGRSYRASIFYSNDEEKKIAETTKAAIEKKFNQRVGTEIVAFKKFWKAEEYHQDYYKKNPVRYKYYRNGCGRDARVKEIWGDEAGGLSKH